MRIRFSIVDPDAIANATASDNGKMPFSQLPDITDTRYVAARFGTMEPGVWLLDGTTMTLNTPEYDAEANHQGFVSNKLSDENMSLATNPVVITIDFANGYYAFRGLSFKFDSIQQLWPHSIRIQGFIDGTQNFDKTVEVDSYDFAYSSNVPLQGDFINKLVFTFDTERLPYHRLRIEDIILGIVKTLTVSDLVKTSWTRTNDAMNTVMPDNRLQFTFYDPLKEYNPDNPEGVWEYLESGQDVMFEYGYELDDGSIEWIPGGRLFTDGNATIANGNSLPQVSFTAISRLQRLTVKYDEFIYSAAGKTFYDLADEILRWANVLDVNDNPEYILDESMKNYVFKGVIEPEEVRNIMQLFANVTMCTLGVDREGKIVFSKRKTEKEDFDLTFHDIKTTAPEVNKYPYLKNLSVSCTDWVIDTNPDSNEIASLEIEGAKNTTYLLDFSPATNLSAKGEGVTIHSATLYCQKAVIVATGTGKIIINGNPLNEVKYVVTKNCNPVGEDCALESKMIVSEAHAKTYLDWMADILLKRAVYSFNDRGFPELDEGDIIGLTTSFTDVKPELITSITVEYNGALSGKMEVLG